MYADSETGLYYWNSRYYDPKTGRGISPDRMGVAWHTRRYQENLGVPNQPPLEINPYVYAANNPLRWIDPNGLWSITAGGYIGVGGQVTFGSDNGNGFLTGRVGFGLGGGISYNPNGGIPGPAPQDPTKGGVVLSCSAKANFSAGPLQTYLEGGAARNYSNEESSLYSGKGYGGRDKFTGFDASGSVGGQFTIYSGRR